MPEFVIDFKERTNYLLCQTSVLELVLVSPHFRILSAFIRVHPRLIVFSYISHSQSDRHRSSRGDPSWLSSPPCNRLLRCG